MVESTAVPKEREVNEVVEEAESPVNSKALSKALTPPVTIKNFFKPKSGEGVAQCDKRVSTVCNGANIQDDECRIVERNSSEKQISCPKAVGQSTSSESKESFQNRTRSCGAKSDSAKASSSLKSRPVGSLSSKARGCLKRSSSRTEGSSSKRQKQASLIASFAKGSKGSTAAKLSAEKSLCPICSKSFPQGTGNTDINKHIDSCLIE